MKVSKFLSWTVGVFWASILAGCGGGPGSNSTVQMSTVQSRFDTWIQAGAVPGLSWLLRSPSRSSTDYLFAQVASVRASPQSGPQELILVDENLTSTLSIPASNTRSVQRVLKDGVIHYRHAGSKVVVSYVGDLIESHYYATDDATLLYTEVIDELSPIGSFLGTVSNNEIFNLHYDLMKSPAPTGLNTATSWASDAAYIAIKSYFRDPLLVLVDWATPTSGVSVNPYSGSETTIEAFFSSHASWMFGGNAYVMPSGSISNISGARVWVADTALPVSSYPTTTYRALIELDHHLYAGIYYPANTRLRYRNQIDSTIQLDQRLVLNRAALNSLRQAVSF